MENLIELRNVTVKYEDVVALKGVNLGIRKGEKIGVVGPSGAGKSSLFLAIKRLIPFEGDVIFSGISERDVGLVFQNPDIQLFMPTVFDDIAFGPLNQGLSEDEVRLRVSEAMEWGGIPGFEDRSPHHLSEGEKKKVAIATVLAMDPEVYLFDEPATGLDPASRGEVAEIISKIEKTVIIATHDLQLVGSVCERIVVINGGRIVADGDVCEILGNDRLLTANRLLPMSMEWSF